MTTVSTCSMCCETKTADEFYRNNRMRDGLASRCKDCMKSAALESYYRRRPEGKARGTSAVCKQCGKTYTRDSARHVYCTQRCFRRNRRTSTRGVSCKLCGAQPYSPHSMYCHPCRDEVDRELWRSRADYRTRARRFGVSYESIDRFEIFDRDGWRCHLCGLKVDQRLEWPHPRSVSLDHVVPMSIGGPHTRENVATAHLDCNMAKGNRETGDQLALIG